MPPPVLPRSLSASTLLTRLARALNAVGVGLVVWAEERSPQFVNERPEESAEGPQEGLAALARAAAAGGASSGAVCAPEGTAAAVALGGGLVLVVSTEPGARSTAALRAAFGFSRREAEVALLLARRWTNQEVAAALGISPHTARHHAERVLTKLGVSSRPEVAEALRRRP